jgi:glycosyltransferase involved in cell wall biosynthesis
MALPQQGRAVSGAPTVSVVVPTRNRPAQIATAVDSALAQTLPPHEVIVVDDGSIEPVALSHPKVRVLRQAEPRGAAAARNCGIDAAAGAWVAFLDSDDRWRPEKLERQLARVAGRAEATLCCCNLLVLNGRGDAGRPHNRRPPSGDLSEWILIDGNTPQTSGLMLPTAAAKAIRFDENLRRHQDWDFFLRAAASGLPISYVEDCLVLYDDSPAEDRLSSGASAAETLAWIDTSPGGALVSVRARHELLCRSLVAPSMKARPLASLRALAGAVIEGRLRPLPTMRWLARSARRSALARPGEA